MASSELLILIITLLTAELLCEILLIVLNLNFKRPPPAELAEVYDRQTKQRSEQYTRAKSFFGITSAIYSLVLLLTLILSGAFNRLDSKLLAFSLSPALHGTVFLLSIMLGLSLAKLPFEYYRNFILEERFGFNKYTLGLWLKDQVMSLFLSLILMGPVIYIILFLMQNLERSWWVFGAAAVILFQLFIAFIFPIWIAPLFNKFRELENRSLKDEIIRLVEKVGYKTTGVYSVDGSKRSSHANAYFAGLGKSKRIVLYDTLLEILSQDQILAVLAHEIGHEKLGHIKKGLVFSAILTLAGFFALDYVSRIPELYQAFGFNRASTHAALLIFMIISGPILFFISPAFNLLSRRFEYQADRFAARAVDSHRPLAEALIALSKNSLSNINPHPLYSFIHYSHPALAERIREMAGGYDFRNSN